MSSYVLSKKARILRRLIPLNVVLFVALLVSYLTIGGAVYLLIFGANMISIGASYTLMMLIMRDDEEMC